MPYFHMTPTLLKQGDRRSATVAVDHIDPRIEAALASFRPTDCLDRRLATFATTYHDFTRYGVLSDGYLYLVEPDAPAQRYDTSWLTPMQLSLMLGKYPDIKHALFANAQAWTDELLEKQSRGYWSGLPSGDNPAWEVLANGLVVVERLSDSLVARRETEGGWPPLRSRFAADCPFP